jgi:hypothetical protein
MNKNFNIGTAQHKILYIMYTNNLKKKLFQNRKSNKNDPDKNPLIP